MKALSLFLGLLFSSLATFSQCENEKTSPFTAVKWSNDIPTVRIGKEWVSPLRFDESSTTEIITFCKNTYKNQWKKRFSEDFVEVFCGMNKPLSGQVKIQWEVGGEITSTVARLRPKNRKAVLAFNDENRSQLSVISPVTLTKEEAIEDVVQFRELIRTHSSYVQVGSEERFEEDVTHLLEKLEDLETIQTSSLSRELGVILGRIGDRHSSIRSDRLKSNSKKFLPFAVAPWHENRTVALKVKGEAYELFLEDFPLLVAIDGKPISDVLELSDYEEVRAPEIARHTRRVANLSDIQFIFEQNDWALPDTVEFTFSNVDNQNTKSILIPLSEEELSWEDIGSCSANYYPLMREQKYEGLFKIMGNTGYIAIPRMTDADRDPEFFKMLKTKMEEMEGTDALILDIRHNGGGVRDLLRLLASYFTPPESPSWVANLAKIRVDTSLTVDFPSASTRGLFVYNSPQLSDADREAIDQFMKTFDTKVPFDESRFTDYFYFVLGSENSDGSYYYDKPVYVLMDERSFSAASVFATSLKEFNNVKIAGVRSDGSSGMSKRIALDNSWAILRLSRMLSFQRDGYPLDRFGTAPDIVLERDLDQVLGKRDTQLETLLEKIESDN